MDELFSSRFSIYLNTALVSNWILQKHGHIRSVIYSYINDIKIFNTDIKIALYQLRLHSFSKEKILKKLLLILVQIIYVTLHFCGIIERSICFRIN